MTPREHVRLAPFTTLRLGGVADFFIEAQTVDDVAAASTFAKEHSLVLLPLGGGSNVLVREEGVHAVVVRVMLRGVHYEKENDEQELLIAEAGEQWDALVCDATSRGLWGIENLAGIPGTLGGAAVQNIGAYGAEFSEVCAWVEVFDTRTHTLMRVQGSDACFGYRTSRFKEERSLVVVRAALRLSSVPRPRLGYADILRAREAGAHLTTPTQIAESVRAIRTKKFPDLTKEGTAGSFFKNPTLSKTQASELARSYPELPQYPVEGGIKIPLAWLLDHALSLKGHAVGGARLFEQQPIVIVTNADATASDVEALATYVSQKVFNAFGIVAEREVETFSS